MTLLPEIRAQLLDAAFGDAERPSGAGRGAWLGRVAIALSITIGVAVAAVFLVGLHGSPAPPGGPAPGASSMPRVAWVNALREASISMGQHDHACRLFAPGRVRNQRFVSSAPPRSITSILPSLASPARGALRVTVRELRALQIDANGIYARYAWQGYTEGVHYYVVPAAVVGAATMGPARCDRDELAAFRRETRRFPAGQRAAAIAYARQVLSPHAAVGVAVVTVGWGGRGASYHRTWRLAQLVKDPAYGGGGGGSNTSTTTSLLVPDNVASVTATYHAQSYPGRVSRTFSVTKRPVRNFLIFHLSGAWDPPHLTFRSSTGAVIARTPHR